MTVNRTTLLDLPLPVTGTEPGSWGDTTNNGLTQYLDIAIAGTLVLSTDADVTLTSTEGDSSATNIGATTAQYAILRWTATGSTTRNITALAQSKTYVVINATGGTQSIVLRGAGPTTGVTIISGEKAFCVWNGSDFVKVSSSAAAGGSNTQVQYNSSGVLAGSSNLTFDGTSLTLGGNPTLSAGTANGVLYLNGSKVATSGSALTFDGTNTFRVNGGSSGFYKAYSGEVVVGEDATGIYYGAGAGVAPAVPLYFGSTGTTFQRWQAGGSEQMRLTSTGLLVGTTSNPQNSKLMVGGTVQVKPATNNSLEILGPNSGTGIRLFARNDAGTLNRLELQGGQVIFPLTTGADGLYFDASSGNLGIGTSSPTQKLTLVNNAASTYLNTTDNTVNTIYGTSTGLSAGLLGTLTNHPLVFYANNAEKMRLDSSGNLGLGVTPSAWAAGTYKGLEVSVGNAASVNLVGGDASLMSNAYISAIGTSRYLYSSVGATKYQFYNGTHAWYTAPSGTAGNAITFTQALTLDASGNLLLGGTSAGASSAASLAIFNGTAPTGSVTNGIILYAEDVSSSSELKVRDEAGNVTTLSPHNFSLIPEGPSEDMAWAYYSEKGGKRINVDMLKLARMVEKLTGEKLVYES